MLIDQTGHARLADFGLLTIVSDPANHLSSSSFMEGGSVRWMSPELIDPQHFGFEKGHPTKSSDCYALGMVIYEIISGNLPFHEYKNHTVSLKVLRCERPPRGAGFTETLWKTLELCWTSQPNIRPSINFVLQRLEAIPGFSGPASPEADDEMETESDEHHFTSQASYQSSHPTTPVNVPTPLNRRFDFDLNQNIPLVRLDTSFPETATASSGWGAGKTTTAGNGWGGRETTTASSGWGDGDNSGGGWGDVGAWGFSGEGSGSGGGGWGLGGGGGWNLGGGGGWDVGGGGWGSGSGGWGLGSGGWGSPSEKNDTVVETIDMNPPAPASVAHLIGSSGTRFTFNTPIHSSRLIPSPTSPPTPPLRIDVSPPTSLFCQLSARSQDLQTSQTTPNNIQPTVWDLALAHSVTSRGVPIPQKMYEPHTQSDRRRSVEEVELEPPIMFYLQGPGECGIPLRDAITGKYFRLVGRDDPMFRERGPSVSIRLKVTLTTFGSESVDG